MNVKFDINNIKETAELISYNVEGKIPFQIIKLAKTLGINVYTLDNFKECAPDTCGLIAIGKDIERAFKTKKIIVVNRDDNPEKRRFIVAYAIGYYLFKYSDYPDVNVEKMFTTSEINDYDQAMSEFALNLLMPADEFISMYNELIDMKLTTLEAKNRISQFFLVPIKAVEKRLEELKI